MFDILFHFCYYVTCVNLMEALYIYKQVEERLVSVEELFDADEVFCSGNACSVLPVGSITFMEKRCISYF